ncbi:MAG: hypothetical protein QUS12_03650 [Methanosarcina sp.]|nr:hypothetical protein [Methanosarcina sp.]
MKSKIKQLCCGEEFSDYAKSGTSKPLPSTQALAVGQIKRDASDMIE